MSMRAQGPQLGAITARSNGDLLRQLSQFRNDVEREIGSRHFWRPRAISTSSAAPSMAEYLTQVDINGRLSFYAVATATSGARRWRKIADLDASGNFRVAGTVTATVVFGENENL